MSTIRFPSTDDAEIVEVEFLNLTGSERTLKLLVDSGFTGTSSFVLPLEASDLAHAALHSSLAIGALNGEQRRIWVTCTIAALQFRRTLMAIVADVSSLSLPANVDGLAALAFLRQFSAWGGRRIHCTLQFELSTDVA